MHPKLKETLDRFYREYNLKSRIEHDPIEFPHRYKKPEDIEIAGLIASSLAYGKVTLFKPVINKILSITSLNGSLQEFIINFELSKDSKLFSGIKYRFNSEKEIIGLIYFIKSALIEYGSLKNLFYSFYNSGDKNITNALTGFVKYFISLDMSAVYDKKGQTVGIKQFFPSPAEGSACKRLNLYLRWMVRSDDSVDFGIWNKIPPSKLIIPLDTHMARICTHLGLTHHKTTGWKMAEEITDNLKILAPKDPVKYDFALCHLGISGECPPNKDKEKCDVCSLKDICK
ncbi:MAG TPA: TIGR02757 family protein [Nitrospinae bacterium]|nr:TIGR02757 family protein [Nitrospinota bacterium]HBA26874.1 TIGR02757 family protein [Nitrospinota bacterium]